MSRFTPPADRAPDGRAWQSAVAQLLWRPELTRRQHPGHRGVFGGQSASGVEHEIDGIGAGSGVAVWIESKARKALDKSDVATFRLKCEDFFRARAGEDPTAVAEESWWPLLVSSEATTRSVRRLCHAHSIVLCDPCLLPLPVLLRAAERPSADEHLSEVLLAEFVRLAEPVCQPMQGVWRIDPERRRIVQQIDGPSAEDVDHLLHLQAELTFDLLDVLESQRPGWLEIRARAVEERVAAHLLSVAPSSSEDVESMGGTGLEPVTPSL